MNKDFWERIDRLEELAGKATQGKWNYCGCEIWANETTMSHDVVGKVEKFEDAQYIDAANPAMILEMIATFKGRLSFLEHELVEKDIELENTKAELKRLEKEADWLADKCACQNIRNGCQCGIDKNYRRNEARKAVTEADNA